MKIDPVIVLYMFITVAAIVVYWLVSPNLDRKKHNK